MDPRFRRSRVALREAVYRLADTAPITQVTISELCREAGVTRDTFYRHAQSPLELLADVLREELEQIAADHPDLGGGFAKESGMRKGVRALLEHVAAHEGVYRNSAAPHLLTPLATTLASVVLTSLTAHAAAHPEILPPAARTAEDVRLLAAYAASGTVGALEVWLESKPLDLTRGEELIVAGSPAFWHGPPEH